MAITTLAVGMLFVGGTLAVAVHLSVASNDQVMGCLVAGDALAKIRLYGMETGGLSDQHMTEYTEEKLPQYWTEAQRKAMLQDCNTYAVEGNIDKTYYCRVLYKASSDPDQNDVIDVAVFVIRDKESTLRSVEVTALPGSDQIELTVDRLVHGTRIVDDASGQVYRVFRSNTTNSMRLDRPWNGQEGNVLVWTVEKKEKEGASPNPLITVIKDYIPISQLRSQP